VREIDEERIVAAAREDPRPVGQSPRRLIDEVL
jgi:hypothetical protein